jgi:ATPase subunit of ABC transporter with duplicated ATPase domains
VICEGLELSGLTRPFDLEVSYGERVAALGHGGTSQPPKVAGGGSGKSHLLRLLAGDSSVAHGGAWRLGARVVPGHFAQTHAHPEVAGRTARQILESEYALDRSAAMAALHRYELHRAGDQRFEELSGGQQARLMILRLELAGSTLLLRWGHLPAPEGWPGGEPTDNLDLESAEALQEGLESYQGTVLAVTHDRWFARAFDRFLHVGADGAVGETSEPVWGDGGAF